MCFRIIVMSFKIPFPFQTDFEVTHLLLMNADCLVLQSYFFYQFYSNSLYITSQLVHSLVCSVYTLHAEFFFQSQNMPQGNASFQLPFE